MIVTVTQRDSRELVRTSVTLPTNAQEATVLVAAYERARTEEMGYRRQEVE